MTSFKVAYLRIFRESNLLRGDEIHYIELYFFSLSLSSSESVLKAFAMGAYDAGPNPEALCAVSSIETSRASADHCGSGRGRCSCEQSQLHISIYR